MASRREAALPGSRFPELPQDLRSEIHGREPNREHRTRCCPQAVGFTGALVSVLRKNTLELPSDELPFSGC